MYVKRSIQSVPEKRPFLALDFLNRDLVISFFNTVQYCVRVRAVYFYRFSELLALRHLYYFPICFKFTVYTIFLFGTLHAVLQV